MGCCLRSGHRQMTRRAANLARETKLSINKVSWQQVGHVTEPGRYMFRFGWLTVAADYLAVWEQFPDAVCALVKTAAVPVTEAIVAADVAEEFHLGAVELPDKHPPSEK